MRREVYKAHGGIQGVSGRNYWTEAMTVYKGGDGVGYFAQQRTSITHRGFCIMEGFADFSVVPDSVIQTVDSATPERRRMGNVEELCQFFASKFPGEEMLKNEDQRTLWNPIIGIGEQEGDKDNRDQGIARYASTLRLLYDEVERSADTVWVAKSRAHLDVWLGLLCTLLQVHRSDGNRLYLPNTGGRMLITGKHCPRQIGHTDFDCSDGEGPNTTPGYFIMVSGADPFPIWISDYSHHFVYGAVEDRAQFTDLLSMRKIIVPPHSVMVANGYVTHGGGGYEDRIVDKLTMRYHTYLVPEEKDIPDAVGFALGKGMKYHESVVEDEDDSGEERREEEFTLAPKSPSLEEEEEELDELDQQLDNDMDLEESKDNNENK